MRPSVALRPLTLAALFLACALVLGAARAGATMPSPEGAAWTGATLPSPEDDTSRVGMATHTVWLTPAQGYEYLRRVRDAGIRWVRDDFVWSVIEPTRGHFKWARTDNLMRSSARLGIKVLALAAFSPPWASGHTDSDKYPPRDPADYARFVAAVAHRYGAGGTFWSANPRLRSGALAAIEIWNEPWHAYFWRPSPDPAAYARLVRAAASAIKARHPEISVLASGDIFQLNTDGSDRGDWFQPLLASDPSLWKSGLVDAWSVHTYCQRLSPFDTTAPIRTRFDRVLLTRSMSLKAGAWLPIWITELGWNTRAGRPDAVSEQVQAQYEVDALRRATIDWSSFVTRSFVYTFAAPAQEQDYNLLRPDGSSRPAWAAIEGFLATGR